MESHLVKPDYFEKKNNKVIGTQKIWAAWLQHIGKGVCESGRTVGMGLEHLPPTKEPPKPVPLPSWPCKTCVCSIAPMPESCRERLVRRMLDWKPKSLSDACCPSQRLPALVRGLPGEGRPGSPDPLLGVQHRPRPFYSTPGGSPAHPFTQGCSQTDTLEIY